MGVTNNDMVSRALIADVTSCLGGLVHGRVWSDIQDIDNKRNVLYWRGLMSRALIADLTFCLGDIVYGPGSYFIFNF